MRSGEACSWLTSLVARRPALFLLSMSMTRLGRQKSLTSGRLHQGWACLPCPGSLLMGLAHPFHFMYLATSQGILDAESISTKRRTSPLSKVPGSAFGCVGTRGSASYAHTVRPVLHALPGARSRRQHSDCFSGADLLSFDFSGYPLQVLWSKPPDASVRYGRKVCGRGKASRTYESLSAH